MKIKMTAPVMSYVEPGSGPFSESTITISLYIPSEQQSDPPRPSESDVFIEDRAAMTVFVRLIHTREAMVSINILQKQEGRNQTKVEAASNGQSKYL
ncbi:heme-binding protein 2 isoform X4 [Myotis lucifugus]|uniref:heme-binding protein 2 isoform X4 n=1 Tax=Myotis lucifugus TaxID=59463 RepID=UPI0006D73F49|nr:heme-binding protein 2 isoform X4 [Myotis lucifugus]